MVAKQPYEHHEIVIMPLDLINKFLYIMSLKEKTLYEIYIHDLRKKFIANFVILKYNRWQLLWRVNISVIVR